jgi:spore maturation protein CgeB
LGIHQGHNIHGYLDTRPFQYCGAGALYFHDRNDAIEQFFQKGIHYVEYGKFNVEDFTEKFNYYQENKQAGKDIRRQAFEYCQKHHNSKVRIQQAIDTIEGRKPYPLYIQGLL